MVWHAAPFMKLELATYSPSSARASGNLSERGEDAEARMWIQGLGRKGKTHG